MASNKPGEDRYDFNFCYPFRELENDRVKLVPFVPAIHSEALYEAMNPYPDLLNGMVFGAFDTVDEMNAGFIEKRRAEPDTLQYAVFDKTKGPSEEFKEGTLAGTMCLEATSVQNMLTEIGYVIIFPQFQRTHVNTNAVGLLLEFCLELPENGGLGLRRVEWTANAENKQSIAAAKRLGFRWEGTRRCDRAVPPPDARVPNRFHNGIPIRKGDPRADWRSRDTAVFSICWDDWEGGVKEHIRTQMSRVR